jgi:hypothetical protein
MQKEALESMQQATLQVAASEAKPVAVETVTK